MNKFRYLIIIRLPTSILPGISFTRIPWGEPEGFHGIGVPFASVYWDYINGTASPTDFPPPYAMLLNTAVFFLIGLIALGSAWFLSMRIRKKCLRIPREGDWNAAFLRPAPEHSELSRPSPQSPKQDRTNSEPSH